MPRLFLIPAALLGREWRRVVDTFEPSPADILEPGQERKLESTNYLVHARSVVVFRRARNENE